MLAWRIVLTRDVQSKRRKISCLCIRFTHKQKERARVEKRGGWGGGWGVGG